MWGQRTDSRPDNRSRRALGGRGRPPRGPGGPAAVLLAVAVVMLLGGCRSSVPHRVWINRDVDTRLVSGDGAAGSVLVAAARSDYKERVVSEVVELLETEAAEVLVVGLRDLSDDELQAERYDAILIVNT